MSYSYNEELTKSIQKYQSWIETSELGVTLFLVFSSLLLVLSLYTMYYLYKHHLTTGNYVLYVLVLFSFLSLVLFVMAVTFAVNYYNHKDDLKKSMKCK